MKTMVPTKAGAIVLALLFLVGPTLLVLRAFGINLNEEQYVTIMGLDGAVGLVTQRLSGAVPFDTGENHDSAKG